MPRKAKKKVHPMPKLGWKDLALYWSAMGLCAGGFLFSLLYPSWFRRDLVDANPVVLSFSEGPGSGRRLWLAFALLFIGLWVAVDPYQRRIPVFGRKDIKYGPPAYPRIFPLLMKDKPKYWVSPKQQAMRRQLYTVLAVFLVGFLVVGLVTFPGCLYGRYELHRDGRMVIYDKNNQLSAEYSAGQVESVCLDTYRTSGGRHSRGSWYPGVTLTMTDGVRWRFPLGPFGENWTEAFNNARQLLERYGSRVQVEGTKDLWKVARDQHMTPAEKALLYALYGVEE